MFEVLVVPNRKALKLAKEGKLAKACWIASYWETKFNRNLKRILRYKPLKVGAMLVLCYPDEVDLKMAQKEGLPVFDETMAKKVAETIDRAMAEGVKTFVFSCDAGVSRSAGMAQAFENWLKQKGLSYTVCHQNPANPNPLVRELCYRMLVDLKNVRNLKESPDTAS